MADGYRGIEGALEPAPALYESLPAPEAEPSRWKAAGHTLMRAAIPTAAALAAAPVGATVGTAAGGVLSGGNPIGAVVGGFGGGVAAGMYASDKAEQYQNQFLSDHPDLA